MSLIDDVQSEVNIEITVQTNGKVFKHIIRGYELVAIQKDKENDHVAFVTKKPAMAQCTWNVMQIDKFDIDSLEEQKAPVVLKGAMPNVSSTAV